MARRVRWFSCFAVAAVLMWGAPAATRPIRSAQPQRIVAVGDLHGDYSVWRDIAFAASIESADGHWVGGRTVLLQAGDDVDREPDSLKIIRDLMRLQKEAPRQGGRVVVLVGNHEAMNMTGDLRYTTPGEFAAFATARSAGIRDRFYEDNKRQIEADYRARDPSLDSSAIRAAWMKATPLGWIEHGLAWSPNGEIGRWVDRNPAVALIDGNLFVHGGISIEYSKLSIDEINRRVAAALTRGDTSPTSIINDPLGPLWYRGLIARGQGDETTATTTSAGTLRPSIEDELSAVLAAYGAKRIVIAHTPVLSGIQLLDDGRLIRIDTGNSRYYNGTPSYLEIIGDRVIPHAVRRSLPGEGGRAQ